jgi:hypothetical protein
MKNKNKFLTLLATLAALTAALATTASAADNLREGNPVITYTTGTGAYGTTGYFSSTGTNDAIGFTNTPVYVATPGNTISVFISLKGASVNLSNALTFVVSPGWANAAAAMSTTNTTRHAIVPQGNTTLITNLTLLSWSAPGMKVSLENPATNPVSITNLTVHVFNKY